MLSCKEATQRMSEALDRPLTTGERLSLEMHLLTCKGCREFKRQMTFLRQATRFYARPEDRSSPEEPKA